MDFCNRRVGYEAFCTDTKAVCVCGKSGVLFALEGGARSGGCRERLGVIIRVEFKV